MDRTSRRQEDRPKRRNQLSSKTLLVIPLLLAAFVGCQSTVPTATFSGKTQASTRAQSHRQPTPTLTGIPVPICPSLMPSLMPSRTLRSSFPPPLTASPSAEPTSALLTATVVLSPQQPTLPGPENGGRYLCGGIDFSGDAPICIAYPSNWQGAEMAVFTDLEILLRDTKGKNLQRFMRELGGKVFVYPDVPSGSFVLSIHDAHLKATGEPLEAEPLRELLEGDLHHPYPLPTIEANLKRLVGMPFIIEQGDHRSTFIVTQARRMGYDDVEQYRYRASQLSNFMEPMEAPNRSFLLLTCSGRQPNEPEMLFPGRYVFVLEHRPGPQDRGYPEKDKR